MEEMIFIIIKIFQIFQTYMYHLLIIIQNNQNILADLVL